VIPVAPEWDVERWFGAVPRLADLRGRAVVVLAFQMLCPGCLDYALPQMRRAAALFADDPVSFVGLHTVFERPAEQGPTQLAAFLRADPLPFPVGIDRADGASRAPVTFRRYAMEGTPTLLLIDGLGRLHRQHAGPLEDMALGAEIALLLAASGLLGA